MKHVEFITTFLTSHGPVYNRGDRALVTDDIAESAIRQRAAREIVREQPKDVKPAHHKQLKAAPTSK
jgi:hypothetical protein